MRALALATALALAGCAVHPTVEKVVERPVPQSCPDQPPISVPPSPVLPNSCVADWYAKASLPPCVEDYLKQLKSQQKTIAKKRKDAAR